MKIRQSLLAEGIEMLCKGDKEIERLIIPRFEDIILLLERYIKEIELFNAAYGLVAVNDTKELITRHILDSIAPLGIILRLLENNATRQVADAGSGAGLPGIPLAVTLPDFNFTLIERMGRRAGFLHNTSAVLGISNIAVEETDLEEAKKGRFSLIVFRAFKPLQPRLLNVLFNACNEKGLIAAYKGKREKTEQEMTHLGKTCRNWETISYNTPFLDEERHLLVIRAR